MNSQIKTELMQSLHPQLEQHSGDEERFRMAMEGAKIGTFDWNILTGEVFWSDNLKTFMGLSPQASVTMDSFQNFVHPEDRERVGQTITISLQTGADYQLEFRMLRTDGTLRWVEARGKVHFNDSGKPVRMVGIDIDITAQKQFEEQERVREVGGSFIVESWPSGTTVMASVLRTARHKALDKHALIA